MEISVLKNLVFILKYPPLFVMWFIRVIYQLIYDQTKLNQSLIAWSLIDYVAHISAMQCE